jgi:hypothetical protein
MLLVVMRAIPRVHWLVIAAVALVAVSGCGGRGWREYFGLAAQADPSVAIRSAEPRWLLIKNPRCCDVPSEPEYTWVEEDKVPTTMKSLMFGKSSLIAPPDVVAKYGSPPGGGRISPRQGGPYKVENTLQTPTPQRSAAVASTATRTDAPARIAPPAPPRGYVVFVDTSRVVIDLAGRDGVKVGSGVSVRRDKVAIVHPITGELLGELDEEVAVGRVVEVHDKFSVVEVDKATAGAHVQVKDRVVLR